MEFISDKIGRTVLSQKSSSSSPQFLDIYGVLLKGEGVIHSLKHGPVPPVFTFVAAIFSV